VDAVEAKTTSGIPSPFRSMTEGVIMTFKAVGSTRLEVHDHSTMGLNWALRTPADKRTPARERGTSRQRLESTPMVHSFFGRPDGRE
jgi:hypothetical protein